MSIPANVNPLLLAADAATPSGYQIQRSLRCNSSDSGYLSRTPGTAGNRRVFTWAGWIKRCKLGSRQSIFSAGTGNLSGDPGGGFYFDNITDTFSVVHGGGTTANITSAQVFRDVSAWFHLVVAYDTTQSTSSNRIKIYVNGLQISFSGTYPSPNFQTDFNNTVIHAIGSRTDDGPLPSSTADYYLADIHFIDGQALTPSSFTEVSATTGQLIPKAYTGTFTGNSFWLKFADNSAATATTLGKDSSGLGNNWTPNNFSVTAGAGNDSLVDTPTSYGTDTSVGGEVRGNYATLNPLAKGSDVTLVNGNLDCSTSSTAGYSSVLATIGVTSGKWYWEFIAGSGTLRIGLGIATQAHNLSTWLGGDAYGWEYFNNDGSKYTNGSGGAYGAAWTTGDVIGVALDADAGTLTFYKNGTTQGQAYSGLTSGPYFPAVADSGTAGILAGSFNFGQRAFAYTAPSGFKALCDTNLPTPVVAKPNTVMDVKLYTGTGSNQSITGLGFSPDFVWIKSRSTAQDHNVFDVVRGPSSNLYALQTNATSAEGQYGTMGSLDANGFSLTGAGGATNANGTSYVAWTWDAGTSTVTNTQGSITSQVRANASAGFSVVTWTGSGATSTQTIGHGLNVSLGMVIVKARDSGSNDMGWGVSHTSVAAPNYLYLNVSSAAGNGGPAQGQPSVGSGSTFSILAGTAPGTNNFNANGVRYVAYCFAPVVGYSSFGSYTGNGSSTDGPFVYTGFRPKWIMVKRTDAVDNWAIWDTSRSASNVAQRILLPDSSDSEYDNSLYGFDILSSGFKVREARFNQSSSTRIYVAFAESPFAYSRAR